MMSRACTSMMMSVLMRLVTILRPCVERTATMSSSSWWWHLLAKFFMPILSPLRTRSKTSCTSKVHQICAPVLTFMPRISVSHSMRSASGYLKTASFIVRRSVVIISLSTVDSHDSTAPSVLCCVRKGNDSFSDETIPSTFDAARSNWSAAVLSKSLSMCSWTAFGSEVPRICRSSSSERK